MSNNTPSIAQRLEAAGVKHPIGWDEMGSSEKDAWEERMLRSVELLARIRARRS